MGCRAAIIAAFCAAMPLYAADDLTAARELTVRQCSQCHTFDKGEKHGQGPNLFGLLGREAAAAPGFVYSEGIKEALKGQVWDTALLDRWLTRYAGRGAESTDDLFPGRSEGACQADQVSGKSALRV